MRAPTVQAGIARAKGRTTRAILEWKGIGPIHFISVYLETGGKLTNNNLQILAPLAAAEQSGTQYQLSFNKCFYSTLIRIGQSKQDFS